MSELDQCLKSMYLVCDESVADDVNRIVRAAIAELEAENAKLRASASAWLKRENDKLKAQLATEVKDWAETDTHVRNVARPILGSWVDGDSDSVPSVGDIVERLVHLLTAELKTTVSQAQPAAPDPGESHR